jgi:hypothetical protein
VSGGRTSSFHLQQRLTKSFSRWFHKAAKRIGEDVLAGLYKVKVFLLVVVYRFDFIRC